MCCIHLCVCLCHFVSALHFPKCTEGVNQQLLWLPCPIKLPESCPRSGLAQLLLNFKVHICSSHLQIKIIKDIYVYTHGTNLDTPLLCWNIVMDLLHLNQQSAGKTKTPLRCATQETLWCYNKGRNLNFTL